MRKEREIVEKNLRSKRPKNWKMVDSDMKWDMLGP
jgi:hypothetical protein